VAIAHVISWAVGTGKPGDPTTLTGVDTTGAQLIVVTIGYFPDNAGANTTEVSGVTDSKGNTYQIAGARTRITGGDASEIWYSSAGSVGASHTITVDFEGSTFNSVCAAAYGGFSAAPVLDQTTGATGNGTVLNSGSVTPTAADELLVGGGTHANNDILFTAGASYTVRAEYPTSSDNSTGYIEDRVVASIASYDASTTATAVGDWAARIATFKAGSGSATISAATPSGTLGTTTTASLGATTDQATGTFYGVVDTAGNLAGVTAAQVKAGQKASGAAAAFSGNSAVSTTTPTIPISGLTSATAYSYAVIQNNTNGDTNLLTGTFTTASAIPNPSVRNFGAQGFLRILLNL